MDVQTDGRKTGFLYRAMPQADATKMEVACVKKNTVASTFSSLNSFTYIPVLVIVM